MLRNKVLLVALIFGLVPPAFAEISKSLTDVKIFTTVEFEEKNVYIYKYTVHNPQINNGRVASIQIDISKPKHSQQLSSADLVIEKGFNWEGKMLTSTFDQEVQKIGQLMEREIIPVGIKIPKILMGPLNWSGNITVMGTVMFGGSEEVLISPGNSVEGFGIVSYGLPGVRDVLIEPDYIASSEEEIISATGVSENEYIENTWNVLDRFYKSISFSTKTLGPTAPPLDFNPLSFLDYIIGMKHEASTLGWITNKGIEMSLDAKLEAAKKKLEQGQNSTAKNILNALINEIEAQGCETYEGCPKGKHLLPEAYALLKYNVLYLIERL
ncbi:MAG: hypothetical protein HY805_07195 [Nitrospirae bacterium]|nr:hypothetical protein [Nitrospirota bacterium]